MASSSESGWSQTQAINTSAWTTPGGITSDQSPDSFPADCIILGLNATIPWDNPRNLMSKETEDLIERLKSAVFIPILFLIGVPCNVVNMAVFYKQGLKDRINMCLFALAVADVLNVTWGFIMFAERIYTQFTDNERYTPSFRYIMKNNVLGLVGLIYIPPLLSAIISTERCVCVLFPLRAQRCLPTRVLAAIIVGVSVPVLCVRFAVTSRYDLGCFHETLTGRKSWQMFLKPASELRQTALRLLDGVLYGFTISVGCPVVVFFTTTITAIRLRQIVSWRKLSSSFSSSTSSSSSAVSSKEVGVTKMLICLSVEFFVLSIPVVIQRLGPLLDDGIGPGRVYTNTTRTLVSLYELCSFTSSSVNFFVYYSTGTKFRQTLKVMLGGKNPLQGQSGNASRSSMKTADCSLANSIALT